MITSNTKLVTKLTQEEKSEMYTLLSEHFLGTTWEDFSYDLSEKEYVMFLHENSERRMVGFSTLVCFEVYVQGRMVPVVFSGDTVVLEQYRSSFGFGREIAQYFKVIRKRYSGHTPYYLLTSKGWRTYRMLPLLFKEFYPNHLRVTPPELKQVIDTFCIAKFPRYYDATQGLLTFKSERQRLRPETGDCKIPNSNNPHIRFFAQQNPRFLNGDELVCIASIMEHNLAGGLLRFSSEHSPAHKKENVLCEYSQSLLQTSYGL